MSLFFNPTPTSNNLPGATTDLINQPNIVNSSVVISEESDIMQNGGKPMKKTKKSKTKSVKKPKTKSMKKPKTKSVKKPKTKSVKKPKTKSVKTSKPKTKSVKKQISLYKRSQLEKLAKKNKISLKKRDGTPKTKLQLFRSLKRKGLL